MAKVILKLGDNISTDIIYPGRYMATVLPSETPPYAFADIPEFNARLRKGEFPAGSVIMAGKNFGCGSSREQAASCLKGWDLVVVAKHFARIFLQNSVNLGLRIVICPDMQAYEGDDLELSEDRIFNKTNGKSFDLVQLPRSYQAIIEAGGLIPYTRQRLFQGRN
jgi:3-isopropylmalate/(R)-2-methylmalate dehydratase small subunit